VPRAATGTIKEDPWKDGETVSFRLRIPYKGRKHWVTLGTNLEGWSRERAQGELDGIMDRVRRRTWVPPGAEARARPLPAPGDDDAPVETIHVTLSRFWQAKKKDVAPNTRADYEWRLALLLSFRPLTPTAAINEQWVDELRDDLAERAAKNRREGSDKKLSPASVNKVLEILAQALDLAVDHKTATHNPARGKRRRMKVKRSRRPWLEPDMIVDLLDSAREWEDELEARKRVDQCYGRRELLALLCLAGPRITETLVAERGEFDLAADHWRIPESKTEAGERTVELTVFAAEEVRGHVARSASRGRPVHTRGPMFPTKNGTPMSPGNVRRMLTEAVRRTNERRGAEDKMLLPDGITPHSLRVTFVSLCFLAGRDPAFVMGQVGHEDARLALEVYTRTMRRKRVDRQLVWDLMRFADEPEKWPGYGLRSGPTAVTDASDADARMRDA
jgi:integrase